MSDLAEKISQEEAPAGETDDLGKAQMRIQLGPLVGAVMSLLVNGRGLLGYPTASSPRKDDILSVDP